VSETDELLKRLIEHERADPDPDAAAVARMWNGIEGRLGGGPPPPDVFDGPPSTGGAWQAVVLKVVGGLAVSGAIAGGAWAIAERDESPLPEPAVAIATPAKETPSPAPPAFVEEDPEPATGEDSSETTETSTSTAPSADVPATSERAIVRRTVNTEPSAETFADEAQLLQRIYAALKRDDPRAALRLVGEHRRRFPAGQLVQERLAVEVEALCRSNQTSRGRSKAAAFEAAYPGSTHLARVRTACDRPGAAD
jgi:hypothetical protein